MNTPLPCMISTVAFRNHTLAEAIAVSQELGYSRLEIWQRHLYETPASAWPDIVRELASRGMSAPVVAPFLSFTQGAERLKETREAARRALEIAEMLGSSRIRTFTDVGPDGVGSDTASEEQWRTASEEIAGLCRAHPRMLFVVETHPHTLADGVESTARLLKEVGQPNFKLNFQPITPFLDAGLFEVMDRFFPDIAHMHWHQMKANGESGYLSEPGQIDFAALAAYVKQRGYRGTVTIEYCWSGADIGKIREDVDFLRGLPWP